MSQKLSTVLTIFGGLLMLLGLTFLASGMAQKSQDESISGAGLMAFALGALVCSGGMYMKARAAQSAAPATTAKPAKLRGGCDLCGTESPAIHCRVHQLHLCPNCLQKHYDMRSCVYVPSTRRALSAKAGRS